MAKRPDAPKIAVQGVTKTYQERRRRPRNVPRGPDRGDPVPILEGIDLEVRSGEFVVLVGHSGCGKSTLLNVVAGFETPTAGRVLVDGVEVRGPDPKRMFIFQENSLFPWMTVEENVATGLSCSRAAQKTSVEELLKMVGLDRFAHYYPHQISGGMGRLAELARALAMSPDVLLMDEPFSALDFMTRCLMREEMLNLMALFQTTIIFITHDLDEAVQLADRIVILSDRPARIKRVFDLPFPHPRDISAGELGVIRRQAYLDMGVNPVI